MGVTSGDAVLEETAPVSVNDRPHERLVGDGFEHLPSGWNVKAAKAGRFERKHDGERLCLTHYTGQDKPWNGKGYQIKEWKKYGKAVRAAKEGRFR